MEVKKKYPKDPKEKEMKQKKKKKMKEKKVMVAKVHEIGFSERMDKQEKVYSLPGQKHDTPGERDPLRIFYETLYQQLPDCELAATWMMEWGLLPPDEAKKVHEKLLKTDPQQKLLSSGKAAQDENTSIPSATEVDHMASKSLPRSRKRKLSDNSRGSGVSNDSVLQKKKIKKQKLST